jgi:hypothetical protein
LRQAQLEVESVRERQLPKAEAALKQSRRGFEEGRFSYLALGQAQKTLFDLREREVEAAARYLRCWSRQIASPPPPGHPPMNRYAFLIMFPSSFRLRR